MKNKIILALAITGFLSIASCKEKEVDEAVTEQVETIEKEAEQTVEEVDLKAKEADEALKELDNI